MLSFSKSGILFILKLQNFLLSDLGSRINPTNVVWTQNLNAVNRAFTLQQKAQKIISFQPFTFKLSVYKTQSTEI